MIRGGLVLSTVKNNINVVYVVCALGGFSECLLPNFFQGLRMRL